MKLQEAKIYIEEIKKEIEEVFCSSSEKKEIDLVKIIQRPDVKKVISKDNQLMTLSLTASIWIEEKKRGYNQTIFCGVDSLAMLEELYINLKYYCRRFEYDSMPEEELREGISFVIKQSISGVALFNTVMVQTWKRENNILKIAQHLKEEGQLVTATILLQQAVEHYEKNETLLIELADCWLEGQQWEQAYETLKKIENPSKDIEDIIMNLEEALEDENI